MEIPETKRLIFKFSNWYNIELAEWVYVYSK